MPGLSPIACHFQLHLQPCVASFVDRAVIFDRRDVAGIAVEDHRLEHARISLPLRVLGNIATKFNSPITATGQSRRIVSRASRWPRCGRQAPARRIRRPRHGCARGVYSSDGLGRTSGRTSRWVRAGCCPSSSRRADCRGCDGARRPPADRHQPSVSRCHARLLAHTQPIETTRSAAM